MDHSSSSSEPEGPHQSFKPLSSPKKLVPNISISMKQSLNELHFNGTVCLPTPLKNDDVGNKAAGDTNEELSTASRPRSSTLNKNPCEDKCDIINGILELELSPVRSPKVVSGFFFFASLEFLWIFLFYFSHFHQMTGTSLRKGNRI